MAISVGDKIPEGTFFTTTSEGLQEVSTDDVFKGKKVVLFGIPGAFTPTCSNFHVPGFEAKAGDFFNKGVDTIACVAVNDAFVMDAFKQHANSENILMLADGSATYTKALGLEVNLGSRGLGVRSQRFAMVVDDGVVTAINAEADLGKLTVSDAESMLALI